MLEGAGRGEALEEGGGGWSGAGGGGRGGWRSRWGSREIAL